MMENNEILSIENVDSPWYFDAPTVEAVTENMFTHIRDPDVVGSRGRPRNEDGNQELESGRPRRRCGRYNQMGHNSRTCSFTPVE
jgi:hypothetical protein